MSNFLLPKSNFEFLSILDYLTHHWLSKHDLVILLCELKSMQKVK
jgi:hypothetical protein